MSGGKPNLPISVLQDTHLLIALIGLPGFLPHNLANNLDKVNRNKCKPMMAASFR